MLDEFSHVLETAVAIDIVRFRTGDVNEKAFSFARL